MNVSSLTDILAQLNQDAGDGVPYDPDEIVSQYFGFTDTVKMAPAWTSTLKGTAFVYGTGQYGKAVYS